MFQRHNHDDDDDADSNSNNKMAFINARTHLNKTKLSSLRPPSMHECTYIKTKSTAG